MGAMLNIKMLTPARLLPALGECLKNAMDIEPFLEKAGLQVASSSAMNIRMKRTPEGTAWPSLSRSTLQKRGDSAQALQDKGLLHASINKPQSSQHGIWLIDKGVLSGLRLRVGSSLRYAYPQHHGTSDGHIPGRAFLGANKHDEEVIAAFLEEHIMGPLTK